MEGQKTTRPIWAIATKNIDIIYKQDGNQRVVMNTLRLFLRKNEILILCKKLKNRIFSIID